MFSAANQCSSLSLIKVRVLVILLLVSTIGVDCKAVATGGAVGFSSGAIGGWGTGLGGVPVGGVKGFTSGGGWVPGLPPIGGFLPFAFPIFGRK